MARQARQSDRTSDVQSDIVPSAGAGVLRRSLPDALADVRSLRRARHCSHRDGVHCT